MNPSNTTNQQDMNQTPSPSDSAVGDLETMLKEKDTEINYLRETMEQNEQVIFKVSLDILVLLKDRVYIPEILDIRFSLLVYSRLFLDGYLIPSNTIFFGR